MIHVTQHTPDDRSFSGVGAGYAMGPELELELVTLELGLLLRR